MKIANLNPDKKTYSCNVYLILGDWKRIEDMNTLVDTGRDPSIIEVINNMATGIGKKKVDQVVITHNHYDHVSLLPMIKEVFNPLVYAFSTSMKVDEILKDGDLLKFGDRTFEVLHTPGHSSDSLCFYCKEEGVLFAGDTPLIIQTVGGAYEEDFIEALERLSKKDIKTIYFGHGYPMTEGCNEQILISLKNVKKSIEQAITV